MLDDDGEGGCGQFDSANPPPPLQDPQPRGGGGGAQVRFAITLDPQLLLG